MREDDRKCWDVTLGWRPAPHEFGGWHECGAHISYEYASAVEAAVARCREWRKVEPDRVLHAISCKLIDF